MREVRSPPNSDAWVKLVLNSMNRPERVEIIRQAAVPAFLLGRSPKSTVRDGLTAPSFTEAPRSLKSMSNPCLFSTIFGWAESILSLLAVP